MLDYNPLIPHDSLVVFLDLKAFDTLEPPFSIKALVIFGFGTNLM